MNSTEPKSPCKDCPNRMLYCHDRCKEYQNYLSEKRRIDENRRQYLKSLLHTKHYKEKNPKFKRLRGSK